MRNASQKGCLAGHYYSTFELEVVPSVYHAYFEHSDNRYPPWALHTAHVQHAELDLKFNSFQRMPWHNAPAMQS